MENNLRLVMQSANKGTPLFAVTLKWNSQEKCWEYTHENVRYVITQQN